MTDLSLTQFVNQLASNAPVPGGGGAAALVGALGVALGNMVGSLTLGKAKYAAVEPDIRDLNAKAEALEARLLTLIKADAEVFEPLSKAYGLPAESEADKAHKAKVLEDALVLASSAPLNIMRAMDEAMTLLEAYFEKGSKLLVSDAGCGALCCLAALRAASLNVYINTKLMKDRTRAEATNAEVKRYLETIGARGEALYQKVHARLSGEEA